jgi:hypothetical protein
MVKKIRLDERLEVRRRWISNEKRRGRQGMMLIRRQHVEKVSDGTSMDECIEARLVRSWDIGATEIDDEESS